MSSVLLDLLYQVKRVLPLRFGGTGNRFGWGTGVVLPCMNRTGSTIALGSVVKFLNSWDDQRVTPTTTASDPLTLGVVVGSYATDGTFQGVAPVTASACAVMVAGTCMVLVSAAVTRGQFAYSGTTSGQATGSANRRTATFGRFVDSGTAGGKALVQVGLASAITGSEYLTRYGAAQDTTDLEAIDVQQGLYEHGSATVVALEVDQPNLMIAATQSSVADAGGYYADVGAAATETLRPTSDVTNAPSAYSSGTVTFSLIDEAVLDTADYVDLKLVSTTPCIFIVAYPASSRLASERITSIDVVTDLLNSAPAGVATVRMRDPATGTTYEVGTIAQGEASPKTVTLTTRPWDSRPWTLDDINHLQTGCQAAATGPFNLRVYRQYAVINYTRPTTVESALQEVGADLAAALVNPMTTAEDIIKGGVAGAPARVAVGTNGQVLTVTAGAVGWAASASGFTNPMTTLGDIIVGDTGGAAVRLAKGTDGQVLTVDTAQAYDLKWAASASGSSWNGKDLAPASPHANDEEFGTADTFVGTWTHVASSGTPAVTGAAVTDLFTDPTVTNPRWDIHKSIPGHLFMQGANGAKYLIHRAWAPAAGTAWCVAAKIRLGGAIGADDRVHLGVSKATPTTTNNEVTDSAAAEVRLSTNMNSAAILTNTPAGARTNEGIGGNGHIYVAVVGNTNDDISIYTSMDGLAWRRNNRYATGNVLANVNFLFLYVNDFNNSGGPVWVAVDWIRFRTDTNLLLIGQ